MNTSAPLAPLVASAPDSSDHLTASLPLRRDDDASIPFAGIALLLVLVALAGWVRWRNRGNAKGGASGSGLGWWHRGRTNADGEAGIRVISSTRLDAHTRLHTVQWHGGQVLIATGASSSPVVLDRCALSGTHQGPSAP